MTSNLYGRASGRICFQAHQQATSAAPHPTERPRLPSIAFTEANPSRCPTGAASMHFNTSNNHFLHNNLPRPSSTKQSSNDFIQLFHSSLVGVIAQCPTLARCSDRLPFLLMLEQI